MQIKSSPYMNALLSDICIGTSAAPTFFPAHHFTTTDASGQSTDFHLIDGGAAANNPVYINILIISLLPQIIAYVTLYIKLN